MAKVRKPRSLMTGWLARLAPSGIATPPQPARKGPEIFLQIATHIGDLLTDEHLYRRLATQATREIADLTWDTAAAQVLSVYHELTHRC
jgi:hypothetical protein